MKLTPLDLERYNRQMLMPGWGEEGQIKLKSASVVVAGIGGLGCPASIYLAAAGFGKLILIDSEQYELSNLNRQILGWQSDLGRLKTESAKEKLTAFNPDISVEARTCEVSEDKAPGLLRGASVVIDGMDNWKTRFIINEACVKMKIPFVHAGIYGLSGQAATILPGKGPCLRCIIPTTPPEKKPFPVVGATPAFFAMIQVMEAIKLVLELGEPLVGKILLFNGENMDFHLINVSRNPKCPVCGELSS